MSGLKAHFDDIRPKLLRFATARLGNVTDAEDVIQNLWLRLETAHKGPVENPVAYLHKMTLNLANDFVRGRNRQNARDKAWSDLNSGDGPMHDADPAPSQERLLSDKQQLFLLANAIRALPERARDVFQRHRIDGLSHAEVAAEMGISKSAVEKHMATAIRHLHASLNSNAEDMR
jgi:RNA polymerase sigma factor (sigma-70 family)